jgi:hypothetical protein
MFTVTFGNLGAVVPRTLIRRRVLRQGIDSRQGQIFFSFPTCPTPCGAHPASCRTGAVGSYFMRKAAGAWSLPTHLHLVSRLRVRGTIPPLPMRLYGVVSKKKIKFRAVIHKLVDMTFPFCFSPNPHAFQLFIWIHLNLFGYIKIFYLDKFKSPLISVLLFICIIFMYFGICFVIMRHERPGTWWICFAHECYAGLEQCSLTSWEVISIGANFTIPLIYSDKGQWLSTWERWCQGLAIKYNGGVTSSVSHHVTIRLGRDIKQIWSGKVNIDALRASCQEQNVCQHPQRSLLFIISKLISIGNSDRQIIVSWKTKCGMKLSTAWSFQAESSVMEWWKLVILFFFFCVHPK